LLLSAGLRVRTEQIGRIMRRPRIVFIGLAVNLLMPLAYLVLASLGLRFWHNEDEARTLLVGLALVIAMPIAGSSAGWAQQSNADLSLSLGLVLMSTLLSPLTTPLLLRSIGQVTAGPHSAALEQLAHQGTCSFLTMWVLFPSALGMASRSLLGDVRVERLGDSIKLANVLCLCVLCYANAAACLPKLVSQPDWDFLGLSLLTVAGLCGLAFASGFVIGRIIDASPPQRVALMFGLGMNNNGSGLVLASMILGSSPMIMMPIILYNLVQHLAAGFVSVLTMPPATRDSTPIGLTLNPAQRPGA
jgi:BASS family bile acid:Na+ symporter